MKVNSQWESSIPGNYDYCVIAGGRTS